VWLGERTETDNRGTGPKEQPCVKTHGAVCARPLKALSKAEDSRAYEDINV